MMKRWEALVGTLPLSIHLYIMKRWQALVGTVSHKSCVWLTSRLPLYLWFQVPSLQYFLFRTSFDEVKDVDKIREYPFTHFGLCILLVVLHLQIIL